uniref:hypothetical protein n=1 Tax=Timspurckia oligopyrenoides TaxID=708627 RepID=UPI001FCCC7EC|nr:hypothetical protein MW591_pgp132 [Timspurckia oligopyrenoides]UNJ17483.1 hypothetical protein [Timspurckia oligopyrenoides]
MNNTLPIIESLDNKIALKVITGINNFDLYNILKVTEAANIAGASYIDICADPKIIKIVKNNSHLPVCTSITNPYCIGDCLSAGADIIELGNFDNLYTQGIRLNANDILSMVTDIKRHYPEVYLCVTIPYYLSLLDQVDLAKKLELQAVSLVQTEGYNLAVNSKLNVTSVIAKSAPVLCATHALSQAINIPILVASNITELTAPIPLSYGAAGIGVGKCISSLADVYLMSQKITDIKNSLHHDVPINIKPENMGVAVDQSIAKCHFSFH